MSRGTRVQLPPIGIAAEQGAGTPYTERCFTLPSNDIEAALEALDAEETQLHAQLVRVRSARGVLLGRLTAPSGASLHAVDVVEASRILGETEDWLQHHGHEADEYGAAIRMGGSRISGYDVDGLLRWRRARTRNAERWTPRPPFRKGA